MPTLAFMECGLLGRTRMLNGRGKNALLRCSLLSSVCAVVALLANAPQTHAQTSTASFGKTTVGASPDVASTGYKFGSIFALTQSGTAVSFHFYVRGGITSQRFTPVLYAVDAGGNPSTLVAQGAEVQVNANQAAGWITSIFPQVALSSGSYLLGLVSGPDSSGATLYFDAAAGGSYWNANTYGSVPGTWGQVNRSNEAYTFYLTYRATGATPAPPSNTTPPSVSGNTTVSQQLSASTGTWSNNPTSYAYQWQRCNNVGAACAAIAVATSSTYTLQSADAGSTLRVTVTASNDAGSSAASSAPTGVVSAAPSAPSNATPPAITGTPQEGQTLAANPGTWNGNPSPTLAAQWQSCQNATCTNISGATNFGYVIASSDVGRTLKVVVTGTNSSGSVQATSQPTATVIPAPSSSGVFGAPAPGASTSSPGDGYKFGSVYRLDRTAPVSVVMVYARGGALDPACTRVI